MQDKISPFKGLVQKGQASPISCTAQQPLSNTNGSISATFPHIGIYLQIGTFNLRIQRASLAILIPLES